MEVEILKDLKYIFVGYIFVYWEEYFMFGKFFLWREKSIGVGVKELIIINMVIFFLYVYGLYKVDEWLCECVVLLFEELKVENNYVICMWSGVGILVQIVVDSQVLL